MENEQPTEEEKVRERERKQREFLEKQNCCGVYSAEHRWFTGQKVGHDSTPQELGLNWVKSGAAKRFRQEQQSSSQNKS